MVPLESARLDIPKRKEAWHFNNDNISNSDTVISGFLLKSNVYNSIERAAFCPTSMSCTVFGIKLPILL